MFKKTITAEFAFDSAHFLPNYLGKLNEVNVAC